MDDLDNQTEEVFQGGTTDQWRDYVDTLKVDIPEVSFKDAGTFVASMTPIIGDAMAAKDVYDELQKDEPNYYLAGALGGAALVGLVPGLGDAAAKAIKKGAKEVFDVAKRVEVDPNAMGSGLGNLTLKPKQDNAIDSIGNTEKIITSKRDLGFDMGEPYDYDLTLKMEDIIDEWASGDINNPKLRKKLGELDITLGNRIGPKADPSTLEIQMPDGRVFYGTGDVPSTLRPMAEPLEIGFNEALQDGKFLKGYDASTASDMADKAKNATAGNTRANALMNAAVPEGTRVGVRLNLNSTIPDMPKGLDKLQTLHKGSFSGTAMSYLPFATVRNVNFNVSQKGRTAIASRIKQIDTPEAKSKYPAMSVDGDYVPNKNLLDEGGDLVEIGLNPGAHHLFIDLKTGQAVKGAEEATVIGDRVYAKGVDYWKKAEAPAPLATQSGVDIPSDVRFKFKKGGAVMDEQMEMAFGDAGERVDPVSGNEVPTGSLPEEVRDDIPAQLSEGEYVVPADVVRFFGVKFFEDIRNEAKQGFADMEANGRIGGEPIGMEMAEDELPFDISELQIVDDETEEQPMMNMGGYMRGYADGGLTLPSAVTDMTKSTGIPTPVANLSGIEMKEYVGPNGEITYIQFINGVAQSVIPEGYTAKAAAPTTPAVPEGLGVVTAPDDNNNTAHEDMMREAQERESIDWTSPDVGIEQYEKTMEQSNSLLAKGFSGLATVFGGPILAGFMAVAKRHQNKKMIEGATARLEDPNVKGAEREKWVSIHNRLSGLDEDGKARNSFTEGLANLLTPDDGMEYVNGVLVDTKTGKVLKPGIANSKGNDVVAPTPTPKPTQSVGGSNDSGNNAHEDMMKAAAKQKEKAVATKERNTSAGLGAQTKKGSTAGSKSGYFD